MRPTTFLAPLLSLTLSTTATALPVTSTTEPSICSCDPSPSVGATLFKQANPTTCGNVATDYTTVPTGQGCYNLNSMYGSWENSVEALVVAKGVRCEFFTDFDCPAKSAPLCLGDKTQPVIEKVLPDAYAGKIRSVNC